MLEVQENKIEGITAHIIENEKGEVIQEDGEQGGKTEIVVVDNEGEIQGDLVVGENGKVVEEIHSSHPGTTTLTKNIDDKQIVL